MTLLFTDVEGSTRLWEEHPVAMRSAVERHDAILRSAIEDHGGYVCTTAGDAFAAAFARAGDAVAAAVDAQRLLGAETWPEATALRVRMGVLTASQPQASLSRERANNNAEQPRTPRRLTLLCWISRCQRSPFAGASLRWRSRPRFRTDSVEALTNVRIVGGFAPRGHPCHKLIWSSRSPGASWRARCWRPGSE